MMSEEEEQSGIGEIDEHTLAGWQTVVDLMAKICDAPAGLIMRVSSSDIEVFVSSQTEGNPYHAGQREHLIGSGLYCEHVVQNRSALHVSDARAEADWRNNPDLELNMVAYHGHPIMAPSGEVFGTICVLDRKPRTPDLLYNQLIGMFRSFIEQDLHSIAMNKELRAKNTELSQSLARIRTLEKILPMCARCKKIRMENRKAGDPDSWVELATYVQTHTDTEFSHGMCPVCFREFYGADAPPYEDD